MRGIISLLTSILILVSLPALASIPEQDWNMHFMSETGGVWKAVACEGNRLCAQRGLYLTIWDITSPTLPVQLGKVRLPGCAKAIRVKGNRVYALNSYAWMQIIDVSDSAKPFIISSFQTSLSNEMDDAYDLDTSGTMAFVTYKTQRLVRAIDFSIPSAPVLRGYVHTNNVAAYGITISGHYAYVGTDHGMQIIDAQDPDHLVLKGTHYTTKGTYSNIVIQDKIAYYVAPRYFYAVDISDPMFPKEVGSYTPPMNYSLRCTIALSASKHIPRRQKYAYLGYALGLTVLDVTSPSSPTLRYCSESDPYEADRLCVTGNTAFFTQDDVEGTSLGAIDITSPVNPVIKWHSSDGTERASALAVSNNKAAVVYPMGWTWGGLRIYDTSDSAAPSLDTAFFYQGTRPTDVVFEGHRLYTISDADYWEFFLAIIDIKKPAASALLGHYALPSAASWGSAGLAASKNHVYCSLRSGLAVFDTTDPTTRTQDSLYPTSFSPVTGRIVLSGNRAYMTAAGDTTVTSKLLILDSTNPTSLSLLGKYDMEWGLSSPPNFGDFDVVGDTVYLMDGRQKMKILDFADPAHPILLGSLGISGRMIRATNGLAYILKNRIENAAAPDIIQCVDVSRPSAPVIKGLCNVWANVNDVAVVGDLVYLAADDAGLIILRYSGRSPLSAKGWDFY